MNDDIQNVQYAEVDNFAEKDYKLLLHSIKQIKNLQEKSKEPD